MQDNFIETASALRAETGLAPVVLMVFIIGSECRWFIHRVL